MPMPTPGAPDAPPFFDGVNVTGFLEGFDDVATDRGLDEKDRCVRLVSYCSSEVKDYIEYLPEFIDRNWKALVKALKIDYRHQDEVENRFTKAYLDALIKKSKESDFEILAYC